MIFVFLPRFAVLAHNVPFRGETDVSVAGWAGGVVRIVGGIGRGRGGGFLMLLDDVMAFHYGEDAVGEIGIVYEKGGIGIPREIMSESKLTCRPLEDVWGLGGCLPPSRYCH